MVCYYKLALLLHESYVTELCYFNLPKLNSPIYAIKYDWIYLEIDVSAIVLLVPDLGDLMVANIWEMF